MNRDSSELFTALLERQRNCSRWGFLLGSLLLHGMGLAAFWWMALPIVDTPSKMPDLNVFRAQFRVPEPPAPPPPQYRYRKQRLEWTLLFPTTGITQRQMEQQREQRPVQQHKLKEFDQSNVVTAIPLPDDAHLPEGDLSVFFDSSEDHDEPGVPGAAGGLEEEFSGSALLGEGPSAYEKMEPPHRGAISPKLIKKVEPVYPKIAFRNRIEGDVRMVVLTDTYGKVSRIRVISGHPFLKKNAKEAITQWVYEPFVIKGFAKPVLFVVVVRFRLAP